LSQGRHFYVHSKQTKYFFSAVILIYLVKGSPFSVIADDYLVSAHMLQLAILFFSAAPLFILSLPEAFLREQLWNHKMKLAIRILDRPWVVGVAFTALITSYFLPNVFNLLQQNSLLQFAAQAVMMFSALLMWWEIIAPFAEEKKLTNLTTIAYIFFLAVLLMPIGFFLLVVQEANYPVYAAAAGDIFSSLDAVGDQQLAGGLLKVLQIGSFIMALLHIVMKWGREEALREGQIDNKNIRIARGVVIHLDDKRK
jgi:putative membrane protein